MTENQRRWIEARSKRVADDLFRDWMTKNDRQLEQVLADAYKRGVHEMWAMTELRNAMEADDATVSETN